MSLEFCPSIVVVVVVVVVVLIYFYLGQLPSVHPSPLYESNLEFFYFTEVRRSKKKGMDAKKKVKIQILSVFISCLGSPFSPFSPFSLFLFSTSIW